MSALRSVIGRHLPYRTSARLSLIFVVVSVLVGLITVSIIRGILPEHPRNQLSLLLAQHAVAPLGPHPDAADVRGLAADLGISILLRDDGRDIRAGTVNLSPAEVDELLAEHPGAISFEATRGGNDLFVLRQDGLSYVFADFVVGMSLAGRARLLAGPVVILLILLAAFLIVRRTVAPLAPLADAVRAIGEGDLGRRVSATGGGEIRELELRVNEMAAAISRAERVKREMLIAIGHEFFSPIARLMFQAERIEDPLLRSKITENLMRINLLFRSLLSVEALEDKPAQQAPLPFPDCITEIASAAGDGLVTFDLPAQRSLLYIDRMRLELLLNNFISNAIRYAPGSAIEVTARHSHDMLTLIVADRGPGVPEEFIEDLGEPFMREDKARSFSGGGGMGLGLYLSTRIVARTGGRMRVRNRDGGGLEVRVEWPCLSQPAPQIGA